MIQKTDTTQLVKPVIERHPLDGEDVEPVRKAVALLLTRKKPDEMIVIRSPEGLKLMHLRYEIDKNTVHKICLMFKRSPELKPYYKAIKSWCEDNKLQWKGKVFNHNRYMEISLNPYLDEITATVFDAKQSIFKVKTITVGANSHDLGFAIQGLNHPYLLALSGVGAAVALALLPIYELFRLPYLGTPAFNALDWPEIFLISWFVIGLVTIRHLSRNKTSEKPIKHKKRIIARIALSLIVASAFFTY